jgi:RimJ/RimL family protein N-acetyltransferase
VITLRAFQDQDTTALCCILNTPEVTRYLSSKIPYPYTEHDAKWWIVCGSKQGLIKAIIFEEQLIGCIGIIPGEFEYQRNGEIGYWLAKEHWGQGFMQQAITIMLKDVFHNTKLERVYAAVFSDNLNSKKVLSKVGFNPEAILKRAIYKNQHFYDNHIFSILKQHIKN